MTAESAMDVSDRAMRDDRFLDRFRAAPEASLRDFDLTAAEVAAFVTGDEARIREHLGDAVRPADTVGTLPGDR